MDELANLQIRVESLEVETAQRRLDKLPGSASKAEKATDGLADGFKRLVGALVALETARRGLDKLVEVQRTFDKLNAGLITATGSSLKAGEAFEVLQKFAQDTPYGLEQATEGFVKLVNLGLTPSERALTSYGNTAAAMGKDLNQMIEAVADAATGEFERLKEFGIKAKQQGDTVAFTFQGTTTKIKNNAADIEEYLLKIGEVNFAGAMKERMNSLDGDIANLSDTWDNLFLNISKQGVGDAIRASVQLANEALQELNDMVASGELKGYLEAAAHSFDGWARDVTASIQIVQTEYSEFGKTTQMEGEGVVNFLIDAFARFPQNVRAFIQIMTTEVLAGFDKAEALAVSFKESVKAIFTDDTQAQVDARYNARLAQIDQVRMDSISSILEERDADINATNARITAAQKLREQYDKDRKAREADRKDRLAQYKIDAKDDGDGGGPSKAEIAAQKKAEREAAALAKKNQTEYDQVVAGLRTQEEAIQFSYDKRLAIIKNNTEEESAVRADLIKRLEKDRQKELDAARNIEEAYAKNVRLAKAVQDIQEDGWDEATKAAAEYQKQMETLWQAMANGTISQEQHEKLVDQVTKSYEKQSATGQQSFIDLDAMGKRAAENIQDAFADFLFDPFAEGLDGMAIGFLKTVQRMAAEAAAAKLTQGLFGSMGGGTGSGWLGTVAGLAASYFTGGSSTAAASMSAGASQAGYSMDLSNFVPGKAAGGPTVGGQVYQVNERAPEIFSSGGRDYMLSPTAGVVSDAKMSGTMGGGISFTQSVVVHNNGQAEADTKSSVTNEDAAAFGEKMRQITIQAIQDEQRPGGLLYGAK